MMMNNDNNNDNDHDNDQLENNIIEWEDFMVEYWKKDDNNNNTPSNNNMTSSAAGGGSDAVPHRPLPSNEKVEKGRERKSRDNNELLLSSLWMTPCELSPEIDDERKYNALSSVRMGCMDIDMDNKSTADHFYDNIHTNAVVLSQQFLSKNHHTTSSTNIDILSRIGREFSTIALLSWASSTANSSSSKNSNHELQIADEIAASGRMKQRYTIDLGITVRTSPTNNNNNNNNNHCHGRRGTPATTATTSKSITALGEGVTVLSSSSSSSSSSSAVVPDATAIAGVPLISPNKNNNNKTNIWDIPSSSSSSSKHNQLKTSSSLSLSPLPRLELIHIMGPIMTRTSLRTLVMKKWNTSYWMQYGPSTIIVFRSREHLDDWMYNPYHNMKQRDYLVKLHVNFRDMMTTTTSTTTTTTTSVDNGGGGGGGGAGGGSQCSGSVSSNGGEGILSSGSSNVGKDGGKEGGILGHRILPIKKKSYGSKNESEMYQFKLERWSNLGCSVLAAFASQEEGEVQILHDTITEILSHCPNNGLCDITHMLN